jgi:hypothetical protein
MRTVDVEEVEVKTTLENYERKRAAIGGIVAGLVAGIVLALFMLVMNLLARQDIWLGMKLAGVPFLGEAATQPGFDAIPVVVGVATHMAISAAWGLGFGMLFYGLSKIATVLLGALWGVVTWFTMLYVVLPAFGLGELARAMPLQIALGEHVLFGVALAIAFLPLRGVRREVRVIRTEEAVAP